MDRLAVSRMRAAAGLTGESGGYGNNGSLAERGQDKTISRNKTTKKPHHSAQLDTSQR